jgi:hypothetical protein
VPAIIYDLKAIGGALRKQRIDDWFDPFSRFNWEGWNTMNDSEVDLQALNAPTGRCRTGAVPSRQRLTLKRTRKPPPRSNSEAEDHEQLG